MEYKKCNRCVMDNEGDKTIQFDEQGICNYCSEALIANQGVVYNEKLLIEMFEKVKLEGKKDKYDCMIGLSGGLDSSYLAMIGFKYGLRMLAVHIDDGFDTEVTKRNVKNICDKYNIDLIIEKPNSEQYMDLIKAFIKAGVPDIAIPQDNVLFATLYKYALENNIKYFLSGSNVALESILQKDNGYDAADKVHIKDIHKKFGSKKINELPLISIFDRKVKYSLIHKIVTLKPLNHIEYVAEEALNELHASCGFEYYGDKHCESIFTRFMQRYYLPAKFNVDKRKSHYSSMIVSNQMTREEAIKKLEEPLYDETLFNEDLQFISKRLEIEPEELMKLINEPSHNHNEYKMSIFNKFVHLILKYKK